MIIGEESIEISKEICFAVKAFSASRADEITCFFFFISGTFSMSPSKSSIHNEDAQFMPHQHMFGALEDHFKDSDMETQAISS